VRQERSLCSSTAEFFKYSEADSSVAVLNTVGAKYWRGSAAKVHTASVEAKLVFYFDIHVCN
jgi:hypothetical protein